jgi:hypothetical protein
LEIKTKIVSCHTTNSRPVKQEVNGTVILPPVVFPGLRVQIQPTLGPISQTLKVQFTLPAAYRLSFDSGYTARGVNYDEKVLGN